jgi:3-oxoacyl-[acyl-carrier-protein] synthase III
MGIAELNRTEARYAKIVGIGAYRPQRIVSNEEICRYVDSSDEWIRRRTGIRTRRFADASETMPVMAAAAVNKALAQAGRSAADLDCVIAATMSHLFQAPPLAPQIVGLLGDSPTAAFDLSAACSGFCHALSVARDLVSAGTATSVAVVGVERMSDIVDPADRSTAFIFGDGAGAVLVGPSATPGIGPVAWGTDPAGQHSIEQEFSWRALRDGDGDADRGRWPYLRMAGPEVYRWVITNMPDVARRAMAAAGVSPGDLAAFIPHQANLRICDAMAAALELADHVRVARDVVEMGNTSAASIPLAMERLLASGEVPRGSLALVAGFGSGLGYAAQVIELP